MKLYVGNLPYQASETDLANWFHEAGVSVDSVNVMRDRFSGEARGFGFVEIGNDQEAERAISSCNGKQFLGRTIIVNEARPIGQGGAAGGHARSAAGGAGGGAASRRGRPRW